MELKEAAYKTTELGLIPEDWELKELKYLLRSKPSYGINAPAVDYKDHLPQYLRITDISEEGLYLKNGKVSVKHSQSNSYKLEQGDIVFARTGASVGKTYLYDHKDGELVYAGFLIKVTPDPEKLNPKLLFAYTRTQPYWNWVKVMSMRSGQPGINGNEYGSLKIPLPPTLEEQKAIATALSDIDTLITNLDKLIAKKKAIKQGAMQRLLKSPAQGGQRLPGFEGEWIKVKLGDIGDCIIGLTYSPNNVRDNGTLVLRSSNIQNGRLALEDNVYVQMDIPQKLITQVGDILICVRNGSRNLIGKCLRIDERVSGESFGAFMSIYRTKYSEYISQAFQSNIIQKQIEANLGATINQITNKTLNSFEISIPEDEKEIEAIASILTDMDLEIESLEANKSKYLHIKQGMMQELLTGKTRLV